MSEHGIDDRAIADAREDGERTERRAVVRSTFPVQQAKAQRPPLRPDTLHRHRLLDWMAVNIHHRLVLLIAEAGYGKTTLLADFARQTRLRTLWFRVDDDDRDWVSVLNYLVAAGREVDPEFAPATAERLAEIGTTGGTRDEIVRTFVRELARLGDEPTALIVDDYHVLDESPEARGVITDMLARAPERFTLVLATRRRPTLAIARLRALGEVAELTTDDLRFTEHETEALFREAYHQPLEPDVLTDLARRTDGWAASLQLVRAAVRERSTSQIRAFVKSLTGVDENLYDYLAEEVVGELEPAMQDFLMRTSILQVVDPALAEVVTGVPQPDARRLIESAERIGLLSRRGETARHTVRYHPLVRDFLEDRLQRDLGEEAVLELHRGVARHGEASDWRLAAHHYAAAGDIADVRRVIRGSLAILLGRGEVQVADGFVRGGDFPSDDPVRAIIESRLDYAANRLIEAEAKARTAYRAVAASEGRTRDVALFNLASLQLEIGPFADGLANARLLSESATDETLGAIAAAAVMLADPDGVDLRAVADRLSSMVEEHREHRLVHFEAITLTNLSFTLRQMGLCDRARSTAEEALRAFGPDASTPALASAQAVIAWAKGAAGESQASREEFAKASSTGHGLTRVECLIEAAEAEIWYGSADTARELLVKAESEADVSLRTWMLDLVKVQLALREGNLQQAQRLFARLGAGSSFHVVGHDAKVAFVGALIGAESHHAPPSGGVLQVLATLEARHAGLYAAPVRVLAGIAGELGLDEALHAALVTPGALSMVADCIVPALGRLGDAAYEVVRNEAHRHPARWRPGLRTSLTRRDDSAPRAASLLDEVGEVEDVGRLRSYVRSNRRAGADPDLGRGLARRLAPRVFVEDLGPIVIRIGQEETVGAGVRRKCLSLLCYLISRPKWSATKEQVLDALWPENDPEVAANSLNQTLYFLRRVFDPRYKEGVSAEYVHYTQELIWLDTELIDSQSRLAMLALDRASVTGHYLDVKRVTDEYVAPFALDFMYDEWAAEFRDRLHIRFLEVTERTLALDTARGHYDRAIELARAALAVDPSADELEALLIRLYRLTGSHASAAEQYEHYSRTMRSNLGIEPLPIEVVGTAGAGR